MDLRGRVAVITGAAQGIGKAHVRALLTKGCKVCMSDINVAKGTETYDEVQSEFGTDSVIFVKCDVTSEMEIKELLKAAVDKFEYVDIVVNNAGILDESNPFLCVDINLNGVIRVMTAAMELMREDKGGHGGTIVNTSSISGLMAHNFVPTYAATKWGIIGYSKSWAAHPEVLNNGIRIVCICPGGVDTDLLNLKEEQVKGLYIYKAVRKPTQMKAEDVSKCLIKVLEDRDNHGSCIKIALSPDSQVIMTSV